MKKLVASEWILICLLSSLLLMLSRNAQAQFVNSANNKTFKIYSIRIQERDSIRLQKYALYGLTDSTLVVVNAKALLSVIETWKSTNGGLLPPNEALSRLVMLRHIPYSAIQWVMKSNSTGLMKGLGWGGAAAAMTVLGAGIAYGYGGAAIVLVTLAIPITLLGVVIGAITGPRRQTNYGSNFKVKIAKRWQKRTITEQLKKMYPAQ